MLMDLTRVVMLMRQLCWWVCARCMLRTWVHCVHAPSILGNQQGARVLLDALTVACSAANYISTHPLVLHKTLLSLLGLVKLQFMPGLGLPVHCLGQA